MYVWDDRQSMSKSKNVATFKIYVIWFSWDIINEKGKEQGNSPLTELHTHKWADTECHRALSWLRLREWQE